MADMISDDQLREMAAHRFLKLVKSKRRKPGVGDYGKFGLTDAEGKELLGFGDNGMLTGRIRSVILAQSWGDLATGGLMVRGAQPNVPPRLESLRVGQ